MSSIEYKNDFKIRIPSGFSAQIVFDMLGEKDFLEFYKKYHIVKKYRSEQRKARMNPTISEVTQQKIKETFRKNPDFYGKVIHKIKI